MNKTRRILVLIISFAFSAVFLIRTGTTQYHNNILAQKFAPNKKADEPYNKRTPLHESDLSYYHKAYNYAVNPIGYATQFITLKDSINYYSLPDKNSKIMFPAEKGKKYILISNETVVPFLAYGLKTWPTYDKNWRYAVPLMENIESAKDLWKQKMYYVSTEDILKLSKTVSRSHTGFVRDAFSEKELAYSIDRLLYDEGSFLSPNLEMEVWSSVNVSLLGLGILFLILFFVFSIPSRFQRKMIS